MGRSILDWQLMWRPCGERVCLMEWTKGRGTGGARSPTLWLIGDKAWRPGHTLGQHCCPGPLDCHGLHNRSPSFEMGSTLPFHLLGPHSQLAATWAVSCPWFASVLPCLFCSEDQKALRREVGGGRAGVLGSSYPALLEDKTWVSTLGDRARLLSQLRGTSAADLIFAWPLSSSPFFLESGSMHRWVQAQGLTIMEALSSLLLHSGKARCLSSLQETSVEICWGWGNVFFGKAFAFLIPRDIHGWYHLPYLT